MSLSTESYKGVRDFYPEDYAIQEYIFSTMENVVQSFGYTRYDASILEPSELYETKTSEEIVNEQTYTFEDRGGRKVTLRPEMTPTVARMVAARRKSLAFPLRWYSIPNLFRYERPQRGRAREHWQLNVDMFGSEHIFSDIEILQIAHGIMKEFGFSNDQFEIRLNDRALIQQKLREQGITDEMLKKVQTLIDKKEKIDNFEEEIETLVGKKLDLSFEQSERITQILNTLEGLGITNARFESTLMRGFDYYTGIVFEIFDTGTENNRSVFGGGRYDNLLEIFDQEPLPAFGFGMGDMVIKDMLETYNLLPEVSTKIDLALCLISEEGYAHAAMLAETLREHNIVTYIDFSSRGTGDKIKFADMHKVPYVICIGEDEMRTNTYRIKKLSSGEEENVTKENIVEYIRG